MLYVIGLIALIGLIISLINWLRSREPIHVDYTPPVIKEAKTDEPTDSGYVIRYHSNNGTFQLLSPEKVRVFKRRFTSIRYYAPAPAFVCMFPGGSIIFNAASGAIHSTTFFKVIFDGFGNKTYQAADGGEYGILDDNFNAVTRPVYLVLNPVSKGFFYARDKGPHACFIDAAGTVLIDRIQRVERAVVQDRIVIWLAESGHVLFSLKDRTQRKLDADLKYLYLVQTPPGITPWVHGDYYVASFIRDETIGGEPVQRLQEALLDAAGDRLSDQLYDHLEVCFVGGAFLFIIGTGTLHYPEPGSPDEAANELKGDMQFGILNASGEVQVPAVYAEIKAVGGTGLFIVNLGGTYRAFDEFDFSAYECFLYWQLEGGCYGVIDSLNNEIIPPVYRRIAFQLDETTGKPSFTAERSDTGEVVVFDESGRT